MDFPVYTKLLLCVFIHELVAYHDSDFDFLPYEENGYIRLSENPTIDDDKLVSMPHLLDFPYRDTFRHEIEYSSRHDEWSNKRLRAKRAPRKSIIPITRLIVDPKAQVDVPKTINNFGAVTRQTFEDEKSPLYHVRNLVGSAKNTVLAAMRIIPQNLIIPSDYKIAKLGDAGPNDENIVGDINFGALNGDVNPTDPLNIANTFEKVGSVLRESVKSGQDAMVHLGSMAQNAKNVLHTAHYTLPKVIMPYHKGIHVERPQLRKLPSRKKQAILLAPRIVDVNEDDGRGHREPAYVKMGHLLDALGVSDPRVENHIIDKVVFEEQKLPAITQFRPNEAVKATLNNLESVKKSVGASSLKDFLVKMKQQIKENAKNRKLESTAKKAQIKTKTAPEHVESRSSFSGSQENDEIVTSQQVITERPVEMVPEESGTENDEKVGIQWIAQSELLKPFMGRASKTEMDDFLKTGNWKRNHNDKTKLGSVLGSDSFVNFEEMYNLSTTNGTSNDTTVGTSMHITGPMVKPFMGFASEDAVTDMLKTYNNDIGDYNYDEGDIVFNDYE